MYKEKKIYIYFIIIAFTASLFAMYQRVKFENHYKTYETVMESSDIKAIASIQNKDYIDVSKDFLGVGVNAIVVFENTIDSLKSNPNFKLSTTYSGLDLNVKGSKDALSYIEKTIKQTIKDDRKIYYEDENTLVIEGKLSDFGYNTSQILRDFTGKRLALEDNRASIIEYMGLGFFDDELKKYNENNINITLRPVFSSLVQDGKKSIDRYMKFVSKYSPKQKIIILGSDEILGGEENIDYLQKSMEQNNLYPIAIETSLQDGNIDLKGLRALIQNMNYQATRLFSTLSYIQERYDYAIAGHHEGQEIMNTYYRAITERNIRVIYFRPFHYKEGAVITDMNLYKKRFDELNARLYKFYGIKPVSNENDLKMLGNFDISRTIKLLVYIAVLFSLCLIFAELFPSSKITNSPKISVSLSFLVVLAMQALSKDKFDSIIALLATVTFPTLSIIYLLRKIKSYEQNISLLEKSYISLFLKGITDLIKCVSISFVGAVFLATLYTKSVYLLEFNKFSGVKISQMIPLLTSIISYLCIIGVGEYFDNNQTLRVQIRQTLQKNVKIWQVIIGFILIGVLGMMIIRSGHDSNVEPSNIELLFRNILEHVTPARPRNKAIFLGFPALIIFVILAGKKTLRTFYIIFTLASTIGQANILNTFSHIRTPFLMSVYRTIDEYIFAIVFTFILVALFTICEKIIKRKNINA